MKHSNNAVVYVSIQYRLGAYGFLGSSEYVEQGGATNLGLFDQRAALLWVQNHISAFGGDPTKVTIIGDSAGGGSVTAQLMWDGGEKYPPFRTAIAQYPWWQRYSSEEQLRNQYQYLLETTNCTNLDCMKSLSEDKLADATQATFERGRIEGAYGYGTFFYGPYISRPAIQFLPSQAFAAGNFSKVPLLTFHSPWEGFGFTPPNINETGQAIDLLQQFPNAKKGFFQRFYELYPSEEFENTFWQRQTWFSDFIVNCPTQVLASSFVAHGVPVWKMIFNAGSKKHGAASPFLFDLDWVVSERGDAKISNVLKDWVVSFGVHGDPNAQSWRSDDKRRWPVYGIKGDIVTINDTVVGTSSDGWFDDSERCRFWAKSSDATQN
ncbi:Alpha/Beta hydrolase protein [Lophiotrema nucula]|uniref:Carboxylic ester hydrolase n=1 Tax=Lophiotrema nucula TaxID=690887 RepID=A0A6A5Z805_9PLEO|nr:Alpha/Beta hydrolase protein [Lophiotrema nucula]